MGTSITRVPSLALIVLAWTMQPAIAQEPPPLRVEPLSPISQFTDDVSMQIRNKFWGRGTDLMNMVDASNIMTAKVTIQPGAVFPWHTHPGPVLITVVQGDFVYRLADDCLDRWYTPGSALIDEGFGNVHTAYNPAETGETIVIATFLGVPTGGPLVIPVEGPDPGICPLPNP